MARCHQPPAVLWPVNGFDFKKVFKTEFPTFAAIARLLVAAEWAAIAMRSAIDMHHARLQS